MLTENIYCVILGNQTNYKIRLSLQDNFKHQNESSHIFDSLYTSIFRVFIPLMKNGYPKIVIVCTRQGKYDSTSPKCHSSHIQSKLFLHLCWFVSGKPLMNLLRKNFCHALCDNLSLPCLLPVFPPATSTWQSVRTCGLTALSPSTMEECPPSSMWPFSTGWVSLAGLSTRCAHKTAVNTSRENKNLLSIISSSSLRGQVKDKFYPPLTWLLWWFQRCLEKKEKNLLPSKPSKGCSLLFSPSGSPTSLRTATTSTWPSLTHRCCGRGPATWPCPSPWPRKRHHGKGSLKVMWWSLWRRLRRMMWVTEATAELRLLSGLTFFLSSRPKTSVTDCFFFCQILQSYFYIHFDRHKLNLLTF